MKLVIPTLEYKSKAIDFISEFREYEINVYGSGSLDRYLREHSYEEWLEVTAERCNVYNVLEKGILPSITYFCVNDNDDIIGMINLRLSNSEGTLNEYGHIGYCIRPTEHGKGYGTKMLEQALEVFRMYNFDSVVLTASIDNAASIGVIRNNGGILNCKQFDNARGDIVKYIISL